MRDAAAEPAPPTIADIREAAARLAGVAWRTPLLSSPVLDRATGARVLVKAESLQRTGSFKIRGAYNRLAKLAPPARAQGAVAASSGNHAQGVAEAARLLAMPATIVMPTDAPAVKAAGVRVRGATIRWYDRAREDRFAIMRAIAEETGAHETPPYEHPDVIAGQGTTGLEIAAQGREMGVAFDALVVNVGGGGLMAGIALALAAESPDTGIWAAEPYGFDDTRRSLLSGRRETNPAAAGSNMDALLPSTPGRLTFAVNEPRVAGGFAVTDREAEAAMVFAFRHLKIVLEPGGAASLAAVLLGKGDFRGATVCVVVTGGNVDPAYFARVVG